MFVSVEQMTYFGDLKLQALKHQRFRSLPQGFWTYGASESQVPGALGGQISMPKKKHLSKDLESSDLVVSTILLKSNTGMSQLMKFPGTNHVEVQ